MPEQDVFDTDQWLESIEESAKLVAPPGRVLENGDLLRVKALWKEAPDA